MRRTVGTEKSTHGNRRVIRSAIWLLTTVSFLSAVDAARGVNDVVGNLITFNTNGGWSWFQDPRMIVNNNQIIIGSVAGTTANGATAGDIRETTYNISTQSSSTFTLHGALEQDDHDVPAFVALPDGRYMAIYQRHGTDDFVRWRISSNPG